MNIYPDITATIGNTPLVALNHLTRACHARIVAKLESFNPCGSVKDRLALSLIDTGQREGRITAHTTIIEPTSGNTGIGLASVAAARRLRLILTMPETMSQERRKLLQLLGAELVLTPGSEGMKGAIARAKELCTEIPDSYMPMQFDNLANPAIHRQTTAEEIWRDTDGAVDIIVAGIGTGGTITGIGEALPRRREMQIIGVEPAESPVLAGGKPSPHRIQGIGAGFIPAVLNQNVIDEVIHVSSEEAVELTIRLAREEGILAGISSGAALHAALTVAGREENRNTLLVVIFPDTGERDLSNLDPGPPS
nr:cysteine synthase A [Deltaproteobacteria bacterium]